MPDKQPTETPVPAAPDPNIARLEGIADDANRRAQLAEQRAAYAAGAAESAARQARPAQPQVDPLKVYAENDLTMSPEDKRQALAAAIEMRAQRSQQATGQYIEQRLTAERNAMEQRFAIESIQNQRPEINDPKNAPSFAAAMTKVKYEADQQGVQLSPNQLVQKALGTYDQMFKPGTTRLPFVEGQSRPDLSAPPVPEEHPGKSMLEETYTPTWKNKIRPMINVKNSDEVFEFNKEYLMARNGPLFKKGIRTQLEEVRAMGGTEEDMA